MEFALRPLVDCVIVDCGADQQRITEGCSDVFWEVQSLHLPAGA